MSKHYKHHYLIVFYDKTDEDLLYMFDNVKDILKFQNKPITKAAINRINIELYRALKTECHFIRFLTGEVMRVYIVDLNESED